MLNVFLEVLVMRIELSCGVLRYVILIYVVIIVRFIICEEEDLLEVNLFIIISFNCGFMYYFCYVMFVI